MRKVSDFHARKSEKKKFEFLSAEVAQSVRLS